MKLYIEKPDPEIREIINNTFPSYKGKKISICTNVPTNFDSYWSGGSKNTYVFYHLDNKKAVQLPTNHPVYEKDNPRNITGIPERIVVVEHCSFRGKDMGLTIYSDEKNITPLLPPKQDITDNEKIVLEYTSRYKNTYGGRTNIRYSEAYHSTKISETNWNEAKQSLISKKLLNKAGSITPKGRNAIS